MFMEELSVRVFEDVGDSGDGEEGEMDTVISTDTDTDKYTVISDCYNANPNSTKAALDSLAALSGGRRVCLLGDMLELGPGSDALHEGDGLLPDTAFAQRLGKVREVG